MMALNCKNGWDILVNCWTIFLSVFFFGICILLTLYPAIFNQCQKNEDCDEAEKCVNGYCVCNPGFKRWWPTFKAVSKWLHATCKDIDECGQNNGGCSAKALCSNTDGSYHCACRSGYHGDGQNCSDINECTTKIHDCHGDAICFNTQGNYNCTCLKGYSGNGKNCSDINECITNAHDCHAKATCSNTKGSYKCACAGGYKGTGKICSDIDECIINTHGCHAKATCSNTEGSYKCTCPGGYIGNGKSCSVSAL